MRRFSTLIILFTACIIGLPALGQTSQNLNEILDDSIAYQNAIAVSEIVSYEQETQVLVATIKEGIEERDDLEEIIEGLFKIDSIIKSKTVVTTESMIEAGPISLQNLESEWLGFKSQLTGWNDDLGERSIWFESQEKSIIRLSLLWQSTLTESIEVNAPSEILERIQELQNSIRNTEDQLNSSRNSILQKNIEISDLLAQVNQDLVIIGEVRVELVKSIASIESPPIWDIFLTPNEEDLLFKDKITPLLTDRSITVKTYSNTHKFKYYLGLISLVFFYFFILFIKKQSDVWNEKYKTKRLKEPSLPDSQLILIDRIFSVSILLSLLFTALILPNKPVVVMIINTLLAIYPLVRVVNIFSPEKLKSYTNFTGVLFFIGYINTLFVELQAENRIILLILSVSLGTLLFLLIRRKVLLEISEGIVKSFISILIWLGFFSQIVAFVSNLIGNVTLAKFLVYGFLDIYFISLLILSITVIFINLSHFLIKSPALQRLFMVQKHEAYLLRQIRTILLISAILIWLYRFLLILEIKDAAISGITAFLQDTITIGSFSFSLGDVIIFLIVIWISIILSKVLRFLLEEEVFPRAKTKRGTSATITTFLRITIITLGFLLAIGASGFPLDQLSLLIGAFGVGIGFGLQNIFNNLVSGFIIATERPMEVGDTIEVGTLIGEVREIGIRSSLVRTYDGSEVIVPNGKLISNDLINWTHSDQQRRLKIPVGVSYGSDIHIVMEILHKVGESDSRILQHPAPYVLFKGFGESSLNFEFRCWTQADDWFILESDLNLTIHDTLKQNGIEIPFPQRDLHLRSVDTEVFKQSQKSIAPKKK